MLTVSNSSPEFTVWQTASDLPALACDAALEIDDLILGRDVELTAVTRLASWLSDEFSPAGRVAPMSHLLDPTSIVVLNGAIGEAKLADKPLTTVDEVVKEAGELRDRLASAQAGERDHVRLKRLRDICLALSRTASAHAKAAGDWETIRPFWR